MCTLVNTLALLLKIIFLVYIVMIWTYIDSIGVFAGTHLFGHAACLLGQPEVAPVTVDAEARCGGSVAWLFVWWASFLVSL